MEFVLTLAKLGGWLAAGRSAVLGAFAWWRVAVVGLAVLTASNGATGLYAYNAGWRNAGNAGAAAELALERRRSQWLIKAAVASGALSADDAAIELSNEQLQRGIDDAIEKSAATLRDIGGCLDPEFLRRLGQLR
jgi:hypothetical protein